MTTVSIRHLFAENQVLDRSWLACQTRGPVVLEECTKGAIIGHLQALTPDDRYDRFSIYMSDAALKDYADSIDFDQDICLGIFERNFRLAGIIHLCIHGQTAELGASVVYWLRGQGLGIALFRSAFKEAKNRGIREIYLATGHPAACHIAQSLGFVIKHGGHYPKAIIVLE